MQTNLVGKVAIVTGVRLVMKFPLLLAATMLPPPSPITPFPQTNPGLLGPGAVGAQSPGALPGNPGSPAYNPFGALPSLNNPGTSSIAPLGGTTSALPGTTTTGNNTPGLITPGTTGPTSGGM